MENYDIAALGKELYVINTLSHVYSPFSRFVKPGKTEINTIGCLKKMGSPFWRMK